MREDLREDKREKIPIEDKFNEKKEKQRDYVSSALYLLRLMYVLIIAFFVAPVILPKITGIKIGVGTETLCMYPTIDAGDIMVCKLLKDDTEIKRGDIVGFKHDNKVYAKRVIGLPGDKIYIDKGKVYVNDKELNEPYASEETFEVTDTVYEVPEGEYFVLGDNRVGKRIDETYVWISFDSRVYDYPYIAREDIIDVVKVTIDPFKNIKKHETPIYDE